MSDLIAHKNGGSYTLEEIEAEAMARADKAAADQVAAQAQANANAAKGDDFPRFQKMADAE